MISFLCVLGAAFAVAFVSSQPVNDHEWEDALSLSHEVPSTQLGGAQHASTSSTFLVNSRVKQHVLTLVSIPAVLLALYFFVQKLYVAKVPDTRREDPQPETRKPEPPPEKNVREEPSFLAGLLR
ncbi:hypothetical protein Efla_000300 [Eimeria flavescens]